MVNNWIRALKKFNKNKDEWCIPKKGSKEYNEVKAIANKLGGRDVELDRVKKELKNTGETYTFREKTLKKLREKKARQAGIKETAMLVEEAFNKAKKKYGN